MSQIFKKTKHILSKIQQMQADLRKSSEKTYPIPDFSAEKGKALPVQEIAISSKSVAKATLTIIGILIGTYFLYMIQNMLILFCVAIFLAAALDPAIDALEKRRVPRSFGVLLTYLIILGLFIAVIGLMIPIIIEQIKNLVVFFTNMSSDFLKDIQGGHGLTFIPDPYRIWIIKTLASVKMETIIQEGLGNLSTFTNQIQNFASGSLQTIGSTVGAGVSVASSVASAFFNTMLVFVMTFFMAVDKNGLKTFFYSLFPQKYGAYIAEKTHAIQDQIGAWVRGQLLLCFAIFSIMFVELLIIGMGKYALTLALIIGLGEFLPFIGMFAFLICAIPIALGMGFAMFIKLLIAFLIIQFLENNVIFPLIMGKSLGLSPIVMILVVIIGFDFFGFIGAFMAIPVTTAITIFISDYTKSMAEKK